jgi:hypothetical protein
MMAARYKTKKACKESIGKAPRFVERGGNEMANFIVAATEIETGASFPVRHNRAIHPTRAQPTIARETAPRSAFILATRAEAEEFKARLECNCKWTRWSFSVRPL